MGFATCSVIFIQSPWRSLWAATSSLSHWHPCEVWSGACAGPDAATVVPLVGDRAENALLPPAVAQNEDKEVEMDLGDDIYGTLEPLHEDEELLQSAS